MAAPLPTAYLNGEFLPLAQARISPLDRGFLFADGVYEVIPVYNGRLFRLSEHLARLARSLREVRIANPHAEPAWRELLETLVERNGDGQQAVYLQVTRGAAGVRDHGFPAGTPPTVFAMCSPLEPRPAAELERGVSAVTVEDIRWQRCDIKSVALLANVLAKQQALDAGAQEAIFLRNGHVIEGAATTLFLVRDNCLITPPAGNELLPGITRGVILELAANKGVELREEKLPVEALFTADEVWIASSTREIAAVTRLDGRPVADGRPGPLWRRMHDWFQDFKRKA